MCAAQVPFVKSLIKHIESILDTPSSQNWMHRWLDVIKRGLEGGGGGVAKGRRKTLAGSFGGERVDLPYGFGDNMSKSIIEHSVHNSVSHLNGAVSANTFCLIRE